MSRLGFVAVLGLGACSMRPLPASTERATAAPSAVAAAATASSTAPPPSLDAGADRDAGIDAEASRSARALDEVASVLFAERSEATTALGACASRAPGEARSSCLVDERYRGDAKAAALARELFERWSIVAGLEPAQTMDGGYRGLIRLEPALPVGADRKHLEWVTLAMRDLDALFRELWSRGAEAPADKPGVERYRFRPITLRFTRSVAARTPSAFASGWTVAYNLAGSLNTSADAVRETLVHEIFHLNDFAHKSSGSDSWSPGALGADYDAIVRRCGTQIACLAPYSPNDTIVRGGTYYSFQPGNGVREYAAELALRYYREQRAVLRGLPKGKPFKCGTAENARSWAAMKDEFFAGVDVVPACVNSGGALPGAPRP